MESLFLFLIIVLCFYESKFGLHFFNQLSIAMESKGPTDHRRSIVKVFMSLRRSSTLFNTDLLGGQSLIQLPGATEVLMLLLTSPYCGVSSSKSLLPSPTLGPQ